MNDKPSIFAELKRRNVYKVAVAYAVVSWLLVQIATQVFPFLKFRTGLCGSSFCSEDQKFVFRTKAARARFKVAVT